MPPAVGGSSSGKRPRAQQPHDEESALLLLQESCSPTSNKSSPPAPRRAHAPPHHATAATTTGGARCTLQRGLAVLGAALMGAMVVNVLAFQAGRGGGKKASGLGDASAAAVSGPNGGGGLLDGYLGRLQSIVQPASGDVGGDGGGAGNALPPHAAVPPSASVAEEEEGGAAERASSPSEANPNPNTKLRGRGEQQQQEEEEEEQPASSSIGSNLDMDAALAAAKARIREERARQNVQEEQQAVAAPAGGAADEGDGGNAAVPAAAVGAASPATSAGFKEGDSDDGDIDDGLESPTYPQVQPAGADATRPPLSTTAPPPLHRRREEVKIQRVLLTVSSTDRGQRINDVWEGDKLDTILATLREMVGLCERGFDLTVWLIAAWKVSLEEQLLQRALACQRIGGPVPLRYWDDFPEKIGGQLSSRHRLAMASVVDDFDFFISIEDDIHLLPRHMDAFLAASHRLALSPDSDTWYPGFSRVEHDAHRDNAWATWETDADDYRAVSIPGAGVFAEVTGNTHQAMWMATREQMYNLDARCVGGWFNITNEDASWVEFWSGALQLWDSPDHCRGLRKGMPVAFFRELIVWHQTDTKLYVRGKGVEPLENIVGRLERQRAAILAGGSAEDADVDEEEDGDWDWEDGDGEEEEEEEELAEEGSDAERRRRLR